MDIMRSYGGGYDGSIPGKGQCPIDVNRVQEHIGAGGVITPTKFISFGDRHTTGIDINAIAMEGVPASNGKNCVELYASANHHETSVLASKSNNSHRLGSARASDFWGVIPQNIVALQLVKSLHEGPIDKITVCTLAFLDMGNPNIPRVVVTAEYGGCCITLVDPTSHGLLTVFAFSYSKVIITMHSFGLEEGKGTINISNPGKYCYEFDYSNTVGQEK